MQDDDDDDDDDDDLCMKMILMIFILQYHKAFYRNVDDMLWTCNTEGKVINVRKMFFPNAEWKATCDLGIDGIKIYTCI